MNINALPKSVETLVDSQGNLLLRVIDQRALPQKLIIQECNSYVQVIEAISNLSVRGAPLIGFCGAAALGIWVCNETHHATEIVSKKLGTIASQIVNTRPTAINLSTEVIALKRLIEQKLANGVDALSLTSFIADYLLEIALNDELRNRTIGELGASLLQNKKNSVLTHCNAGSLATVFYGTALGIIYSAAEKGLIDCVYIDETRPVGQGARLTSWELSQAGIEGTLICDNMAASVMAAGKIDAVIIGADRICSNGDVANKIGSYGLSVLAAHHNIPFYVAAPLSTFDFSLDNGTMIPIEQRASTEITSMSLPGINVFNPAFDVTPAELITCYITEKGIFTAQELDDLGKSI